jgi:crotonobetainyl-CoA:carnitine CoA-transferase CaiB-like acyl-CoA transferase
LCELIGRPELVERQYDPSAQEAVGEALAETIAAKPLAAWLELFRNEDVSVGPVATLEEAVAEFGEPSAGAPPELGEDTEAWRRELAPATE